MLNVVAIMGRLVADPELRTTQSGTNVCSFRIACDRNFARQGEQRQADFIDIVAWRQQAEFVSKYFQKGSLIAIEGSLQTRQYQDKNGNNRTAVEVVANNISFAGPKNSNGSNQGGSSYQNAAPSYQNAAPARPAAVEAAKKPFAAVTPPSVFFMLILHLLSTGTWESDIVPPPRLSQTSGSYSVLPARQHLLPHYPKPPS